MRTNQSIIELLEAIGPSGYEQMTRFLLTELTARVTKIEDAMNDPEGGDAA